MGTLKSQKQLCFGVGHGTKSKGMQLDKQDNVYHVHLELQYDISGTVLGKWTGLSEPSGKMSLDMVQKKKYSTEWRRN